MRGAFKRRQRLSAGSARKVDVQGTLTPDPDDEAAKVLFLIVQQLDKKNPTNPDTFLTVQGEGDWKRPRSGNALWKGKANRQGELSGGGKDTLTTGLARGIGVAVVVKKGSVEDGEFLPPSIEALTWCADFDFN